MAKQGGLGQRLLVGGYDISGDIQALDNVHGGPMLGDVTDITQYAHSRLGLQRDGGMGATVYFDAANAHPVLDALPTADVLATYLLSTLAGGGNTAACCVAKQIGYDPTRSAAGDLTLKTQFDANGFGLEWGEPLTAALRTDTAPAAGTPVDDGAATAFGGQAYLQLVAFTGTTITVAVQHATTSGGTYSNVMAFTAVTAAPAWQRIAVPNTTTINEFVKVTTTGTFSSATFAVVFVRNKVAGQVF